ncbi:hypothetical protein MESS4_20013 [Mesorhizobium sp. STM 4661]|nr:hypothetical protein MESS4_20013 [Mesorhizobium sp. STM 4661]
MRLENHLRQIETDRANSPWTPPSSVILNTSTLAHKCRQGASIPSLAAGRAPDDEAILHYRHFAMVAFGSSV